MSGLAYNSNGVKTTYVGTKYNFNAGTSRICVRTAAGAGGVLTYPLTSDSSASQYCKIKVNINGTPCYLATQGQTQDVKNTLPAADRVIDYQYGQLEVNSYSDYNFVSNSLSGYTETNSVQRGTLKGQERVLWEGKYVLDHDDIYVPYYYTRYTNSTNRAVPVYEQQEHHNYSETTRYTLSVNGLANYTSSLNYNTKGVTRELQEPILYNQQQKNIVTNTTPDWNYAYSTNVLPPYLYTNNMTRQLVDNNGSVYTADLSHYVDQYTAPYLCPSYMTFKSSEPQVIDDGYQNINHQEPAQWNYAPTANPTAGEMNYYISYYSNYDSVRDFVSRRDPPPTWTSRAVYTRAKQYGNYYNEDESTLKSTYGQVQLNGQNVNTGRVITVLYSHAYYQSKKETTVFNTYKSYASSAAQHNTDIRDGFYDYSIYTNGGKKTTSSLGARPAELNTWSAAAITYRTYSRNIDIADYIGEAALASTLLQENGYSPDAVLKSASNTTDHIYKRFFGNTSTRLASTKTNAAIVNGGTTGKWTQRVKLQNTVGGTFSDTEVYRVDWPERTVMKVVTHTYSYMSFSVNWTSKGANSFSVAVKTAIKAFATGTKCVGKETVQEEEIHVSGYETEEKARYKYISGAVKNVNNITKYISYSYSYIEFTDAYNWVEQIPKYEYHTLATVSEKHSIKTYDTRYTFYTSSIKEVYKNIVLNTNTTRHTYYIDIVSNNANV